MSAEKSAAIVLRTIEFSETSCVVTLYTREFGKITGLAKGARRKKSPFESALDVLSLVRLVFLRKIPPAMDLLTEAKLERRFRAATVDLDRLYSAYYLIELLLVMTEDSDAQPTLFDAAESTILALDSGVEAPHALLARFELQLLRIVGHQPVLDACANCGRSVPASANRFTFSSRAGGLVCSNCRPGAAQLINLNRGALAALQELSAGQIPVNITDAEIRTAVRSVLNHFENNLLGFRPRVQTWLN